MQPAIQMTKKIDDIEIYFEIYAKGELLECFSNNFTDGQFVRRADNIIVLLHGNGGSLNEFSGNVEAWCEKNYCIAVDSRGHGKTTAGESDYTIDLMAEDLSKLCDEMNIGKFKIIGFSDGGNIALTYAVRHPERLSALVCSGANINPSGLKFLSWIPIYLHYLSAKAAKNNSKDSWLKYQLLSLMINYPHISPRLLKNIDCPALIIDGDRDMIKPAHTQLITDSIPGAVRKTIRNCGHNTFYEKPEVINRMISEFIENAY